MPISSLTFAEGALLILLCQMNFSNEQQLHQRNDKDSLADVQVHEYCLTEVFEPTCLKNELIAMKTATYGRMRLGRCLEDEGSDMQASDTVTLGCFVDVLHLLDQKCSGRNRCSIRIPDADLVKEKPCRKGLTAYMEAEYECLTVIEEDRTCVVQVRSTSNPLHIMLSSGSSSKLSCGTKSQPWRLEAPAGQQINVSLLDFSANQQGSSYSQHPDNCHQVYGYITEKQERKNVSICAKNHRMAAVYKSSSNIIEIVLNQDTQSGNREISHALVRFTAIGCSNLVPPEDSWLRRNDNEAVVGCYSSHQTWHLRCVDNQWIGVIGNCTREAVELPIVGLQAVSSSTGRDYQTLILVAIVCFGVGICLIVICVGVICLRRYGEENLKKMHGHGTALLTAAAPLT